jgi:hypothetical protein
METGRKQRQYPARIDMKIAFVNDSCERLGVEYISAVLKQAGHEVRLFVDPQLFDDENIAVARLARHFDRKRS